MRLFIPPLGTSLRLTSAWTCSIHREARNLDLRRALLAHAAGEERAEPIIGDWYARYTAKNQDAAGTLVLTLPEETVLKIERIYLRLGQSDYDSITFLIKDCPDKRFVGKKCKGTFDGRPRFWVKLHEANTIDCEIVESLV